MDNNNSTNNMYGNSVPDENYTQPQPQPQFQPQEPTYPQEASKPIQQNIPPVPNEVSSNGMYEEQNTAYIFTEQNQGYASNVNNIPYNNANYADGYNNYIQTQTTPSGSPKPPKKTGKKVGMIMGAIAIALCIGIGSGAVGYLIASNTNILAVQNSETSSNSDTEQSTIQNKDSNLTIQKVDDSATNPTNIQEVVDKVSASVVEITTESVQTSSYMGQYITQGAGSGVIVSSDGYIITNNHVIEGASSVVVKTKDGTEYEAKLIGTDDTADVALIKIEAKNLTPATFADSSKLAVGQTAIAIGNPLGSLGGTVTNGIISALDREITLDGKQMNLLQTNAAINPGNSGGGLFDENGNLIGMVVAKSSGSDIEGLGFAIPANDIVSVLDDLMNYGYVTGRPSLGVTLVDVTSRQELFMYRLDKTGVYISQVESDSCAEKAGLQSGDCIEEINGTTVSQSSDVSSVISSCKAGDNITLKIYRDGETKTIQITLDEDKPDTTLSNSQNEEYFF